MIRFLATLFVAVVLTCCGYATGFDLPSRGIRTVAVEVAGNQSFRQRVEIPLTAEINRALPLHAGLTPVSYDQADSVLSVEIQDIRGRSLIQGRRTDPVREGALDFSVRVILRDRASGTILTDRRVFDRAEFRSPLAETEETAIAEAARDLARKIALALEADF